MSTNPPQTWLLSAVGVAIAGATWKAMLLVDGWDSALPVEFRADLAAVEVTGTGYASGGVAVTGVTAAIEDDVIALRFNDIDFGGVDLSDVAAVAVYADTGNATTDAIIGIDDFGLSTTEGGGNLVYQVHEDGFITFVPDVLP